MTAKKPPPRQPPHTQPSAPRSGPGRPRKPRAPRSEAEADLAADLTRAEVERDRAAVAHRKDTSVAAEIRLLRAELGVASSWSAYCRSQGEHTHALKYGELATKLAGRLVALRELEAADKLDELLNRARREDALAGKGGR